MHYKLLTGSVFWIIFSQICECYFMYSTVFVCVSIGVMYTQCKLLLCAQFSIVFTQKVDEKQLNKYLECSQHNTTQYIHFQSLAINDYHRAKYVSARCTHLGTHTQARKVVIWIKSMEKIRFVIEISYL